MIKLFRKDRISPLEALALFAKTELKTDLYGNEYVLLSGVVKEIQGFDGENGDKTAFEAVANHVHILDDVTAGELRQLAGAAPRLCRTLLALLCEKYPGKQFVVYAEAVLHDSFILRFHQPWSGEPLYYERDISTYKEFLCSADSRREEKS